jgi:hypothetical protein
VGVVIGAQVSSPAEVTLVAIWPGAHARGVLLPLPSPGAGGVSIGAAGSPAFAHPAASAATSANANRGAIPRV